MVCEELIGECLVLEGHNFVIQFAKPAFNIHAYMFMTGSTCVTQIRKKAYTIEDNQTGSIGLGPTVINL